MDTLGRTPAPLGQNRATDFTWHSHKSLTKMCPLAASPKVPKRFRSIPRLRRFLLPIAPLLLQVQTSTARVTYHLALPKMLAVPPVPAARCTRHGCWGPTVRRTRDAVERPLGKVQTVQPCSKPKRDASSARHSTTVLH